MKNRILSVLVSLLALCFIVGVPALSQTEKKETAEKSGSLEGPPYSLEQVIKFAKSNHVGGLKLKRALALLDARGIAFPATEENLQKLRDVKASDAIISKVREKSPKPPPPPPPKQEPKPAFSLTVLCAPAECEVSINNQGSSATHEGKIEFTDLTPGLVVVSAKEEGFESRTVVLTGKNGQSLKHEFVLPPTDATQLKWGDALFASMMEKAHLTAPKPQVVGTLTIKLADVAQWDIEAALDGPGAARIEITKEKQHVSVACVLGRCEAAGKGSIFGKSPFHGSKEERTSQEIYLLRHVEIWLANEYSSVMARMSAGKSAVKSHVAPGGSSAKELQIDVKSAAYSVTLDPDLHPSTVRFDTATTVKYSGYRAMKAGTYPATTEIQFADNEKHSVTFVAREFTGVPSSPPAKPK